MKKKVFRKSLLVGLFFLCSASAASAIPQVGNTIDIDNGTYGTTNGGEFYIDILETSGDDKLVSFCVEKNEYIDYTSTFIITSISDNVVSGGGGAVNGSDPLSSLTQWVFYKYVATDFFGTKSDVLANNVQNLIWAEEGEQSWTASDTTFYNTFSAAYLANPTVYDKYVVALNLNYYNPTTKAIGNGAQSQLAVVPEPATMLLFGTGLAGLAAVARRRRH